MTEMIAILCSCIRCLDDYIPVPVPNKEYYWSHDAGTIIQSASFETPTTPPSIDETTSPFKPEE